MAAESRRHLHAVPTCDLSTAEYREVTRDAEQDRQAPDPARQRQRLADTIAVELRGANAGAHGGPLWTHRLAITIDHSSEAPAVLDEAADLIADTGRIPTGALRRECSTEHRVVVRLHGPAWSIVATSDRHLIIVTDELPNYVQDVSSDQMWECEMITLVHALTAAEIHTC
ncbi:hypothetical protein [Fodinicola acaciae]|uniref:hypothetical protein n=1 Tax=Fodinicola acaciae TaxID=2681555 RepID=UPI0013D2E507|nr:hypothetical protein [Fodinicola acaciae]